MQSDGRVLEIPTARVFQPLLQPARYKGAKGGRGSGKSHFFCGLLIEEAIEQHIRCACLREVQNSIKESVKQLLEDKIRDYGLDHEFVITDSEIRGPYDSLFVFKGLQNTTAAAIKSFEGFNRAYFEEAQAFSVHSIEVATPTFGRTLGGAEMLFAWNPFSPKDAVDRLFAENAGDPDFVCVEANWHDNPWFPPDLKKDMLRDRSRDPDKYAHVWGGKYRKASQARVFHNWTIREFDTPSSARFYFGADWGFSIDPTCLIRCWIDGRTLYVDYEAYKVGCEIDHSPNLFQSVPASHKWPIVADSARPETISYMNRHGYPNVKPAIKGPNSVEEGVEFLKNYDIVVHPRCVHTIDELSFYSYKVDKRTDEVLPVLEDKKNHVIDSLRYAVEPARKAPMIITRKILDRAAMRY